MNALIISLVIISICLLLVLLYAHSITKELEDVIDQHRQATNQIKRLNKSIRSRDLELLSAYVECAAWKEQYLELIRSDTDFSKL